jgi:hypothetical protein
MGQPASFGNLTTFSLQSVWAVPGMFGSCCGHDTVAGNGSISAERDEELVVKLQGYLDWAEAEPKLVGLIPWHWPSYSCVRQGHCPPGSLVGGASVGGAAFPKMLAAFAKLVRTDIRAESLAGDAHGLHRGSAGREVKRVLELPKHLLASFHTIIRVRFGGHPPSSPSF